MKKINESSFAGSYKKEYDYEGKVSILEIIKTLVSNSVQIDGIRIFEDVEMDMQRINGSEYGVQDFIKNYDYICRIGRDLSYAIIATFNNMHFSLSVDENSQVISLLTDSPLVELEDILNSQKLDTQKLS